MKCNDAVAALVQSIENGTPLSDEQRDHLQVCDRCSTLLASARELQTIVASNPGEAATEVPALEAPLDAAQREVRHASRRKTLSIAFAVLVAIVVPLGIYLLLSGSWPSSFGRLGGPEIVLISIAMLIVAVPAIAIAWLVRASRRSAQPIYKRLKPGRQLSGVCLGLAERFNANVTIVRLVFLVALFADGLGFWLYVLLDLAMPIHPADREHLLRFRIQRWMERRQMEKM